MFKTEPGTRNLYYYPYDRYTDTILVSHPLNHWGPDMDTPEFTEIAKNIALLLLAHTPSGAFIELAGKIYPWLREDHAYELLSDALSAFLTTKEKEQLLGEEG